MKKVSQILAILTTLYSGALMAQDINTIFNNKLTRDANLSNQTTAINGMMASYGEVQTSIYRYDGSFEDAINNMQVPSNANVEDAIDQSLGNGIGVYMLVTEQLDPKPMSTDWYSKAREKASELTSINGKSMSMTISSEQMQNRSSISVGDKVQIRIISLSSPYIDLDNLKVVEGTWVSDMVATTVITQEMLDSDSGDFEDEWEEEEMDMDVDLPKGAQFVSFDDVADTEYLQGDVNYVVEMSTDEVINIFRNYKKRFMNSFEQSEFADNGTIMTNFYLLEHQGELKKGDDVVSMTIQPAPKSILSDVLGRNQGTWTLISISRWIEEDY